MIGIINLYKPVGKTSHDMVYFIRRTLKTKRVGHTGTLDPCAEGVLPILVGRATSLSDYLMSGDKVYIATVKLGIVTDTYDTTGTVTEEKTVKVTEDDIKAAVQKFLGEIEQIPPMYSAIKIGGKKLCDMARRGEEIERAARKIRIDSIKIFDFFPEKNEFKMEVCCSKGTYIRSLCYDIGKSLGCGAAMSELIRQRTGNFDAADSFKPDDIEKAVAEGDFESFMIPVSEVLRDFPRIDVCEETKRKICNGLRLRTDQIGAEKFEVGEKFTIYSADEIICLAEVIEDGPYNLCKIDKGFY